MATLDEAALQEALHGLPDWTATGGALVHTFTLPSFVAAIALVQRVATLAEEAGHHPDILVQYNRVTLTLTSHDAGGITTRDVDLAHRITHEVRA